VDNKAFCIVYLDELIWTLGMSEAKLSMRSQFFFSVGGQRLTAFS
jgi:hypothetical protein